ncbi:MAG: poly-gamma-glutamate hydrolase family protein [Thermodesulfobacteriota bacterium]
MDQYLNYDDLKVHERLGADYRIRWRIGDSGIAVISIHGGEIEPGTTRIADAIAGPEHSFYSFEGIKTGGNLSLHITSTHFDEPIAMEMACHSKIIISIHGCADMERIVYMGGLDDELKQLIIKRLHEAGFPVDDRADLRLGATDHKNVCNLCGRGMGIQMEISRGLRAVMFRDLSPDGRRHRTPLFYEFTGAVRKAIAPFARTAVFPDVLENTD